MSFLTPQVQATPPRNFTNELAQTAAGFAQTAPTYFALESQYEPAYQQLNLDLLRQNLLGYDVPATGGAPVGGVPYLPPYSPGDEGGPGQRGNVSQRKALTKAQSFLPAGPSITQTPGHHPGLIELTSLQRGADIGDVMALGPAATAAFLRSNPYLAQSLFNLSSRTNDSPILQELNARALAALQSGGELSPQDLRDIEQATRAGFSARGMQYGQQGVGAELMNRDAAVRAREAAAQQFAAGVQGLNTTQAGVVSNAAQVFANTLSDPFQAILSRPARTNVLPVNQLFNPTNPYSSDLYNTNFNANAAASIANANNQSAVTGAFIKGLGSAIGGAAMASDRRLKTGIRKVGTKTAEGANVVEFSYRGQPEIRRGVDAQDLEKHVPWAVVRTPSGHRIVDLNAVDVPRAEVVRHSRSTKPQPSRAGVRYFNMMSGKLEVAA